MYPLLFRLALRYLEPERAHELAKLSLRYTRATAVGRTLLRRWSEPPDPVLETRALGLNFPTPLGVAAGLDKDGSWFEDLGALGFGYVEVGTVTALGQDGNPRPRIVRVVERQALLNRMGFPNPGAETVARRLGNPGRRTIVGVNLGKSALVPLEAAGEDYRVAVRELAPVSDYLVINVSSPNTPGLRQMQATELLRPLLIGVRRELETQPRRVPLLVKIAPDLPDEQIEALALLAVDEGLDGIIAVNTTTDRRVLVDADARALPFTDGGVSGAPLRRRAVAVLRRVRAAAGERLVLVSVGGIETAEDVWERIGAGAALVQAYTGFVYGGPGWAARINRELARRVRETGASTIQELVGRV